MQLKGKIRLLLVALAAVLVVGVFWGVSSLANKPPKPAVGAASSQDTGDAPAPTSDEVKALKSYGLQAGDLPAGTQAFANEEFRNYAAASALGVKESDVAGSGRVDGLYQVWLQKTAQMQYEVHADLFTTADEAAKTFLKPISAGAGATMTPLDDPKLGDVSRMFAFTSQSGGEQFQGWAVQWVRGRVVFDVRAVAPPGELQEAEVLKDAKLVDGRAVQDPLK